MTFHSFKSSPDFYSNLITPVVITPPAWELCGEGMFFTGSCFADNLYGKYQAAELNAMSAPFGNIYNPESLAEAAAMLSGEAGEIKAEECFNAEISEESPGRGSFRHFMFHSLISGSSAAGLAASLNSRIIEARSYLATAEAVVITLGTSLVYRLKSGRTVSNCHKQPGSDFERVQLTVVQAASSLTSAINSFRQINPKLKFIVSLSPVRHLRDNAAENSLSKAVLRCAIEENMNDESVWYFPSYEIMLDELRDYRWFADDLCHPSDKSVSFIISRFIDTAYSNNFKDFINRYDNVLRDLNHKPINPESKEYKQFRARAEEKKNQLRSRNPNLFSKKS